MSYNERVEELNKVTQQRDTVKKQYDEWRKKRQAYSSLLWFLICVVYNPTVLPILLSGNQYPYRLDEFMAGFNAISLKLKEMYQVCEQIPLQILTGLLALLSLPLFGLHMYAS